MRPLMRTLALRLVALLALLLLGYGVLVALLGNRFATEREEEALQRLSYGLARHIIEHWPEVTVPGGDGADREALLQMLMTVNPGIQVYLLDAEGRVAHCIGDPAGMAIGTQVDLGPVRAFLGGAKLPLRGTDPSRADRTRLFSAAMFPPRAADAKPPGYLYIVLDGVAREQVAAQAALPRIWQGAASIAALSLLATLVVGAVALLQLTRPLQRLAQRMREFNLRGADEPAPAAAGALDEVRTIEASFETMAQRIQQQADSAAAQAAAHREVIANVAHDLRTPLTALHGHLEALGVPAGDEARRTRLLAAAVAQSDKVRRLSQQLFELATLQSIDQVLQRERFCIDELVSDAVQKFELATAAVALDGPPPGRVEVEGDLQLIERALTNLIDNAVRHGPNTEPVRVRVECGEQHVDVVVEDHGPGLPAELQRRLEDGAPVRDAVRRRPGGGIGGLGLAIAQRIAELHGGSLKPLPAPAGGTRLCLSLPRG
jgi:signal transduction histidine kinase